MPPKPCEAAAWMFLLHLSMPQLWAADNVPLSTDSCICGISCTRNQRLLLFQEENYYREYNPLQKLVHRFQQPSCGPSGIKLTPVCAI